MNLLKKLLVLCLFVLSIFNLISCSGTYVEQAPSEYKSIDYIKALEDGTETSGWGNRMNYYVRERDVIRYLKIISKNQSTPCIIPSKGVIIETFTDNQRPRIEYIKKTPKVMGYMLFGFIPIGTFDYNARKPYYVTTLYVPADSVSDKIKIDLKK